MNITEQKAYVDRLVEDAQQFLTWGDFARAAKNLADATAAVLAIQRQKEAERGRTGV